VDKKRTQQKRETDMIVKRTYMRKNKGKKKRNQDGHSTTTLMDEKPTCLLCIWTLIFICRNVVTTMYQKNPNNLRFKTMEVFNSLDLIGHCYIINNIYFIMDVMIITK
jgi:hypothetical protein